MAAEPFMRVAVQEAEKGLGRTSPNPAVGAVVVRDGRVVSRGHHARAGGPHAEVVALRGAGARARGADLYITLEPCDHWGKTPPCSIAILEAGIRRVFVGSRDPNPLVNGRGIARLRRAGVEVVLDVLRDACDALNAPWFHFIRTGRPFVTLKVALTLDGRIATSSGDSRWVTGAEARAEVHRMRDRTDAILVGAGTARADDPRLTTRLPGRRGHDPIRIVLDSRRRALPRDLALFRGGSSAPTLLATTRRTVRVPAGVEVLRCGGGPRVDLDDLLSKLAMRGITHLLVEGGAATHRSFLESGAVDRVVAFVAPKILGGGRAWLDGPGPDRMAEALSLRDVEVRRVGGDLMVTGTPERVRRTAP
jgi:diaminohydroxyphosphoribosylaminopyrimidine deaminase/5-amino-6-(5-phosphoribosylamino)uracil reductase